MADLLAPFLFHLITFGIALTWAYRTVDAEVGTEKGEVT